MTQSTLRSSLPRLVAEGLVIVLSILLAFSIDAWWDSTQERTKEAAYLSQLESDLEATLADNASFGARAETTERAVGLLLFAYHLAELPPTDSIEKWWGEIGYEVVQPTLGTVEALVSTGDLALIRDDELRARLPHYLSSMTAFEGLEAIAQQRFVDARQELNRHFNYGSVMLQRIPEAVRDSLARTNPNEGYIAGAFREMPAADILAAVRSPEVYYLLGTMSSAHGTMLRQRIRMGEETDSMLVRVRAARQP